MKICPECGEEVRDMDVMFHRCSGSAMPEKEKNQWLTIIAIILAALVFLGLITGTCQALYIYSLV